MATEADFTVTPITLSRILLAVDDDDDESSHKAFNYACTIAKSGGYQLDIVSVLETGDMNIFQSLSPDVVNQRRSEIEEHLKTYVNLAKDFGVTNTTMMVGEGKPEHVILDDIIPASKPDLIILGSHKHRVGHIAAEIIREATESVIIVR